MATKRNLLRTIEDLDRQIDRLRKDNQMLSVLLQLEPGLKKYRKRVILNRSEEMVWDLDGARRAIEFERNRELAEKYIHDPRVVDEERKEGV